MDAMAAELATMTRNLYDSKALPAGNMDVTVTKAITDKLWSGVEKGWGQALPTDYDTPDALMLQRLRDNVWQFSAAKNYSQLKELGSALIGPDGKLRTWDQFKEAAYKINDKHINQWLRAEYELAVNGAQMAAQWVRIEENAATLPLLEFDAVLDGQTSPLCRSLHGTRLPVGHPFWKTYYPPNHWGCRSAVRQLASGIATPEEKIPSADIPAMFKTNLGQQGLIFPADHPYYKGNDRAVLSFGNAAYNRRDFREGRKGELYVSQSKVSPAKKRDTRAYLEGVLKEDVAEALAHQLDTTVYVTPEFASTRDWRYGYFFRTTPVPGRQPDLFFNNRFWEIESHKEPFGKKTVANMLSKGRKQSPQVIMKLNEAIRKDELVKKVENYLKKSAASKHPIKEIIAVDKDNNILFHLK